MVKGGCRTETILAKNVSERIIYGYDYVGQVYPSVPDDSYRSLSFQLAKPNNNNNNFFIKKKSGFALKYLRNQLFYCHYLS